MNNKTQYEQAIELMIRKIELVDKNLEIINKAVANITTKGIEIHIDEFQKSVDYMREISEITDKIEAMGYTKNEQITLHGYAMERMKGDNNE